MTDEELDIFLIETLRKIREILKDSMVYIESNYTNNYEEIIEDYKLDIQDLDDFIHKIKTIDDLALMDEDSITLVYEFIQEYADNFIISSELEQKARDLEEYSKIEELLDLFLDYEDEDYEDEE